MPPQLSIGSGLVSVIGLSRIAKVVNIFGWDEYIEESIENKSYIGALWSLGGPSTRNIFKTFCSQILAWNYAVEISKNKRFRFHSYLVAAKYHPAITDRTHQLLYDYKSMS